LDVTVSGLLPDRSPLTMPISYRRLKGLLTPSGRIRGSPRCVYVGPREAWASDS